MGSLFDESADRDEGEEMSKKETLTDLFQHAFDKRKSQLTPEQQEKNRESAEEFRQAISDVWNNRPPTPWAVNAMKNSGESHEIVKEIADMWEQRFKEFKEETE